MKDLGERPAAFGGYREPIVIAFRRALRALRQSPLQHRAELTRMFARLERQRARHFEMLDVVMCRICLRKDGSDAHVLDPCSVFLELTDRTLQCCNGFRRRLSPGRGSPHPDPWRFDLRRPRPSLSTGYRGNEQGGVGNAAGHDSDGIERFGKRLDAMAI